MPNTSPQQWHSEDGAGLSTGALTALAESITAGAQLAKRPRAAGGRAVSSAARAVTGFAERVQRNLQERRQDVARRVLGRPLEVANQRGANANALRTYTMPLTPEVSAKARLGMADGCPQAPIKPASAAAWFGQGKKGSRAQSGAAVERAAPMACRRPVLPTAQPQQRRPWRAHAGSPCHTGTS